MHATYYKRNDDSFYDRDIANIKRYQSMIQLSYDEYITQRPFDRWLVITYKFIARQYAICILQYDVLYF